MSGFLFQMSLAGCLEGWLERKVMLAKNTRGGPSCLRKVRGGAGCLARGRAAEKRMSDTQIVELALAAVSSPFAHGASV